MSKLLVAKFTGVRLFSGMDPGVRCQLMLLSKLTPTIRALEWLFSGMSSFMVRSLLVGHEFLAAEGARVPAVVQVGSLVSVAYVPPGKSLATN